MPHIRRHSRYQAGAASASVSPALHSQLATPIAPASFVQGPAITNLAVVPGTLSDTGVTIAWNVVPGAQGRLQYGTDPTLSAGTLLTTKELGYLTAHSQAIPGVNPPLLPGTTYYYRVVEATTQAGVTGQSVIQSFTTTGAGSIVYTDHMIWVDLPTLDESGVTAVHTQIIAWIAGLPNGTGPNDIHRYLFRPTGIYRLGDAGRLLVSNKQWIEIWGMATSVPIYSSVLGTQRARFLATGNGDSLSDSGFGIGRSANICNNVKLIGVEVQGSNPSGGTTSCYSPGAFGEFGMGVTVFGNGGSHHIVVADCYFHDLTGHSVYAGSNGAEPQLEYLTVKHNFQKRTGVMGIALTNGRHIVIEDNYLEDTCMYPIDLEQDGVLPAAYVDVVIRDNVINRWNWRGDPNNNGPYAIVSHGGTAYNGNFSGIVVQGNHFQGGLMGGATPGSSQGIIDFMGAATKGSIDIIGNIGELNIKSGAQIAVQNSSDLALIDNVFITSGTLLSSSGTTVTQRTGNTPA